jgi:hypothetical protein
MYVGNIKTSHRITDYSHLQKRRVTYVEQWKFYMRFWKKFLWTALRYLRPNFRILEGECGSWHSELFK